MTPERWQLVKPLLQSALELAPSQRAAFLDSACTGDHALRQELESLIAAHEQAGRFIEQSPLTSEALVGKTLGSYRIERPLGRGGMGEVYLATDSRLGRQVALKLLPPELTRDRDRLHRFRQEARAASALNHPNILTIYDVGQADSTHFIASEFVAGETLRNRIGSISQSEALEIAIQIASALSAAHAAGVVHRDIKPENIMLRRDGYVKVLDFGLAKLAEPVIASAEFTEVKTHTGTIMGTGYYMSPEQARGQEVDARSDIWSLGVVLYELMAGRRPFEAPTLSDVVANILHREPEPLKAPPELQRIVQKALSKELDRRYQSIADLLADLKTVRGESRPVPRRLTAAIVAVAVVLIAGGVAALVMLRRQPATSAATAAAQIKSVAVLPFVNMSDSRENEYLADGMTEEIINALAQLPDLKVVSRTSVFAFKGKNAEVRDFGEKLGVAAVVEGSVQRSANRLRITAKLVDVRNGYYLWSDRFDRELTDIFAIQDEIARAVASALHARLSAGKSLVKPPTRDLHAYELYVNGRQAAGIQSRASVDRAITFYQAALARDPQFVDVWAGLADLYSMLDHRAGLSTLKPEETYRLASEAADKALQLEPSSAEAHAAKGHILMHLGQFQEALRHLERALELNPNSGTARVWYATVLRGLHRYPEARVQYHRAREADPMSNLVNLISSSNLWNMGQYEDAIEAAKGGLTVAPEVGDLYVVLARAYAAVGNQAEADKAIGRAATAAEKPLLLEEERATVLALLGRKDEAKSLLARIEKEKEHLAPSGMMRAYAAAGDVDMAMKWAERFIQQTPLYARGGSLDLPPHPAFQALRGDPRFLRLRRELNLPVD